MKKRLYIFDMDGTLLPNTTACLELAKMTGTRAQLQALETDFASGRIDTKGFALSINKLWGALDPEIIYDAFAQSPKLRNIRKVTQELADAGGKSCLISMSPNFFAHHFREFGFDFIYASVFPRNGELLNPNHILIPEDKPRLAQKLCANESLDYKETVAFGDSMSDYFLFRSLHFTVAVNPDLRLEQLALTTYRGDDLSGAFSTIAPYL